MNYDGERPRTAADGAADAAVAGLRILVPAARIALDPDGPTVSVVIPAMNEARNLPWVAARMPAGVTEIVLVDGRSRDDTIEVARRLWPDVRILTQTRRGKGNALACGFHAARGDIIVMIDADGSMDPGEIPYYVDALRAGADYAKGSRFNAGGGSVDITRIRALGNRALNGITNKLHGTSYSDLCYGYNAFWRRILPVLDMDAGTITDDPDVRLWGDGFEVETLINIRVHNAALQIAEVSSFETERLHGASNLNAVSDGLRVLRTIFVERRDMRRGVRLRGLVQTVIAEPQSSPLEAEIDAASAYPVDPIDTSHRDYVVIDLAAYEAAKGPERSEVSG